MGIKRRKKKHTGNKQSLKAQPGALLSPFLHSPIPSVLVVGIVFASPLPTCSLHSNIEHATFLAGLKVVVVFDAVRGGHGDRPLHGADHAQHGDKEPGNIARLAQGTVCKHFF